MAKADGQVLISLDIDDNTKAPIEKAESRMKELGKGAGDELDKSMKSNANKAEEAAKKASNVIEGEFKRPVTKKLDVEANQAKKEISSIDESTSKLIKGDNNVKFKVTGNASDKVKQIYERTEKATKGSNDIVINEKGNAAGKIKDIFEAEKKIPKEKTTKFSISGNAKEKISDTTKAAKNAGDRFSHLHDIIMGTFIGGAIQSGISAITGDIREMISSGIEYGKVQQKMLATWTTLTGNATKGQAMVDVTNKLSVALGQDTDVVDELDQQFYHVFNNKAKTEQLTKSVLTMGDAVGMAGDDVERLGLNFTHMMAGTKLQLGDFNMISDQLPMFGENLLKYEQKAQKNTSLTMSELRKQMTAGKISAEDAENVMNDLGKKYSKASDNLMGTLIGMSRVVKSRVPALVSDMTQPFLNAENPVLGVVSKWVQSNKADQMMKGLGENIKVSMDTIIGAFNPKFTANSFNKNMQNFISNLGAKIIAFGDDVAEHKDDIVNFFKVLKQGGQLTGKLTIAYLKALLPVVQMFGNFAAKHPKLFGFLITGIVDLSIASRLLTKPIGLITSAYSGISKVAGKAGELLSGAGGKHSLSFTARVKDATSKGISSALTHVRDFNKSAGKMFSNVKAVVKDETSKGISLAKRTITRMGKGIAKGLRWTARIITKGAQLALKGLQKVMSATRNGVKKLFLAMKANPWTIWVVAIMAVIAVLVELYKHNKKFRNFVNGIIKSARNMAKSVGKWFKSMYNDVVKIVRNLIKAVTKRFRNLWRDSKDIFKNGTKTIRSVINVFYDFFTGKWSKLGKDIKRLSSNMWKLVKSIFRGAYDYLNDLTGGRLDRMVKALSRFGQSFERGFHNIGKAVGRIWSDVWKTVKGLAEDGINAVIGVINAGINGIDGVIHAFGGKKHAIGRIGKVHFATGTGSLTSNFRRSIDRITPAVVNDRPGARNPELIYRHATGNIEWMKGRNAETMLMPGDEVANDHDSALLAPQLGISHFASGGIGSFFSGIGGFVKGAISGAVSTVSKGAKWLKNLFKTATKIIGHPVKSLEELFKYKRSGKGIFKILGKNMFGIVKDKAVDWWKSLWSMVDLNGSGITGGVAHTPGAGWKVTSGFGGRGAVSGGYSSHDGVDFSGARLVRAMLPGIVSGYGGAPSGWGGNNGIGEYIATHGLYNAIYQELNGKSNSGAKILVKEGETVKAGDPIAELGPNASHVHVGVTKHPMFSIGGSSTNGWLDATKLKSSGKSDKKSKGSDNTIRKQVGGGFWKLISKIAGLFGDASGSGDNSVQPSGSHKDWLKEAGITSNFDKWNYIINHESGWNPKATNGGSGAYGLPQSLPGSKMASAGSDWRSNPITQLKWMKSYVNSRYGGIGNAYRYWLSHHNYANGGIINGLTRAILGEDPLHPREHVINTGKPSSDGLLADAISSRAKNNPSGVYAQMQSLITSAHNSQRMFGTQLQTGSSLQDTVSDSKLLKQMAADMHKTAQKGINGDVYLGTNKVGSVLEQRKNKKDFNSQFFAGQLKNQGGLN